MTSYLGQYFDASINLSGVASREQLEAAQVERLKRLLATILITGSVPKRLGADATDTELALDKKRARRVAHAIKQSLDGWIKRYALPMDDEIRRSGAQLSWESWRPAWEADVREQLRIFATYALAQGDERWGKSAIVRLTNELNWVSYALRD